MTALPSSESPSPGDIPRPVRVPHDPERGSDHADLLAAWNQEFPQTAQTKQQNQTTVNLLHQ